jgi:hypothetical protein
MKTSSKLLIAFGVATLVVILAVALVLGLATA